MQASANDIDHVVLSLAKDRWRKVAMIIAQSEALLGEMTERDCNVVAERIEALVAAGKLEAQGNLKRWRWSEVRLPADD